MWTLVTMNGIPAVFILALLGSVIALTHRLLLLPESGGDDGGIGDQPPRSQLPRGPFDALAFRTHTLPQCQESRLGLSA
jgi:hypothetical protein